MMPLIRIDEVSTETKLALWYMEESDQELLGRYPYMAQSLENMRSRTRRQERLCACALLEAVTGDRQPVIHHDAKGKPFLTSGFVNWKSFSSLMMCLRMKKENTDGRKQSRPLVLYPQQGINYMLSLILL